MLSGLFMRLTTKSRVLIHTGLTLRQSVISLLFQLFIGLNYPPSLWFFGSSFGKVRYLV